METNTMTTKTNGTGGAQLQQFIGQLALVREYLTKMFPEREQPIDNMLTAFVAGEHCLMVGIPGTGKSLLAREFSACIKGSFYEYLFSKFTTPEEFIGPFSISGLKADKYERVLTGRLAEAEVAFLDEIFKSNSASLNTLLPILNERIVFQGGGAQPIPLRVAVAASNELPTDPSLQALWDRLSLRCFVEPLRNDKHRQSVMLGLNRPSGARPTIDTQLLQQIDVNAVPIPPAVIGTIMQLRRQLEATGIIFGDRRWVKSVRIVRAFSLVCGLTQAENETVAILSSVLWDKEQQAPEVAKLINKVAAPFVQKAREIFDEMVAAVGAKPMEERNIEELSKIMPIVKTAHARIEKIGTQCSPGRERDEVKKIATTIASDFNRARESIIDRHGLAARLSPGKED